VCGASKKSVSGDSDSASMGWQGMYRAYRRPKKQRICAWREVAQPLVLCTGWSQPDHTPLHVSVFQTKAAWGGGGCGRLCLLAAPLQCSQPHTQTVSGGGHSLEGDGQWISGRAIAPDEERIHIRPDRGCGCGLVITRRNIPTGCTQHGRKARQRRHMLSQSCTCRSHAAYVSTCACCTGQDARNSAVLCKCCCDGFERCSCQLTSFGAHMLLCIGFAYMLLQPGC
jgi:hypothetical protein